MSDVASREARELVNVGEVVVQEVMAILAKDCAVDESPEESCEIIDVDALILLTKLGAIGAWYSPDICP